MGERLLTPSKITAWLDCAHYLSLRRQVEDGLVDEPAGTFGSFARLLVDKGLDHEAACLADYEAAGRRVLRVPDKEKNEGFAQWVRRVGTVLDEDYDVIFQLPLVHDGVRGVADFVEKVTDDHGVVRWEPVDAKLTRVEAKPGHVLQLCFYADALAAMTGRRPAKMHLWLGSGKRETLTVDDFGPYWRRIQRQLATVLNDQVPTATVPEPCRHCEFCEFFPACTDRWRSSDSLIYVNGIRTLDRQLLQDVGVSTLQALAERVEPVGRVRPERLARLVGQATLQVAARVAGDQPPPWTLIEPGEDAQWGRGLELLPEPTAADVFLDFEGHPFWRADTGLFFLLGLILREPAGTWVYRAWWAHDLPDEGKAVGSLIDFLAQWVRTNPGTHIYHYNHTERSSLERLTAEHGTHEVQLQELVQTGRFVDLLAVARNAIQVGTEGNGLKHLERLTTFERQHEIDQGAGAVVSYERWMKDHDEAELTAIAAYNEDDVRATRALRDWLVAHRPDGTPWRAVELEPDDAHPELDEQVAELHAYGPETAEHLLGDVLGYWRREWLAHLAPLLTTGQKDTSVLLDEPDVLAGLAQIEVVDQQGKKGQATTPVLRCVLPEQAVDDFTGKDQVVFVGSDGAPGYSSVKRLDPIAGEVELLWSEKNAALSQAPSTVVRNDFIHAGPKVDALADFAAQVLLSPGRPANTAAAALLERRLPTFTIGGGPQPGTFSDDLDEMASWATQLDHSYVAIQGPPGTGKTFRAAHLIRTLILAGQRVGVTAFSHNAIDNVLDEVVAVMTDSGCLDQLRAVRKVSAKRPDRPGRSYVTTNRPCGRPEFNLVAGTTWLFANQVMREAPVDVLLIDEAGQLALADALAAAGAARNLVLLGDPLQLPQVRKAAHPHGSGRSVLEHVLGEDVTLPPERGVFLTETRRMHPDVCSFISQEIYQGRLTSHASCADQTTALGTGLRWLRAEHADRTTESPEEAELVAEHVNRLIGTPWTDQHGVAAPLDAADIMVVAPYNDQVHLIRARLDSDPRTRGVPVGTVDKFQGRQAAVVFFTMTTSSSLDMVRGADFLFSRNRLNVAVSRARCLAYLVCTEELLNSRARTVEDMRLISTLCAFAEASDGSR